MGLMLERPQWTLRWHTLAARGEPNTGGIMLRRSSLTLAVLLTIGAAALAPGVSAGGKDFAVGGGSLVGGGASKHFSFSAHAGPNGPSGHVILKQESTVFGDFELQGHVSCLTVVGNRASIGVTIEKGTGTAAGQSAIILFVEDNGNAGTSAVPDQFDNSGYVSTPAVCPIEDPSIPIESGNINVN